MGENIIARMYYSPGLKSTDSGTNFELLETPTFVAGMERLRKEFGYSLFLMLIDNLTRPMLMLSHAACGVLGENRNPGKTERPRPSHQNHLVFKDVTWHLGIARKPTMWGWILYRKTFWSDPKSYNERSLSNNMRHFLFASAFTQESDAYLE